VFEYEAFLLKYENEFVLRHQLLSQMRHDQKRRGLGHPVGLSADFSSNDCFLLKRRRKRKEDRLPDCEYLQ
jgi:hypothetical protein